MPPLPHSMLVDDRCATFACQRRLVVNGTTAGYDGSLKSRDQGGPRKKNSWYQRGISFPEVPTEGEGYEKSLAKIFFRSQKLKFFDFYRTCLNVEGARRIPFKVFLHILAGMGGICVEGHEDPWSVWAHCSAPPWALIIRKESPNEPMQLIWGEKPN